jgi:hypothetical protein
MSKSLIAAIVIVVFGVTFSPPVHATPSGWDRIKSINQYKTGSSAGKTVFVFENLTCTTGAWYLPADANQALMLKVLVSALLSGRLAHANYTALADGCQVSSVSIGSF